MSRKLKQLTAQQIGEIRSRVKLKQGSISQIARDFSVSRVYVYDLLKDKRYDSTEEVVAQVMERKLNEGMIERLESLTDKVLTRIENGVVNEDDIRKLNDLFKNLTNVLQLMKGKPTEIKETRKFTVNFEYLKNLPPEKRSLYLLGKLPDEEIGGGENVI